MLFRNVKCYTNSLLAHIHANIANLLTVMCTLDATSVILGRLECTRYNVFGSIISFNNSDGTQLKKVGHVTLALTPTYVIKLESPKSTHTYWCGPLLNDSYQQGPFLNPIWPMKATECNQCW